MKLLTFIVLLFGIMFGLGSTQHRIHGGPVSSTILTEKPSKINAPQPGEIPLQGEPPIVEHTLVNSGAPARQQQTTWRYPAPFYGGWGLLGTGGGRFWPPYSSYYPWGTQSYVPEYNNGVRARWSQGAADVPPPVYYNYNLRNVYW